MIHFCRSERLCVMVIAIVICIRSVFLVFCIGLNWIEVTRGDRVGRLGPHACVEYKRCEWAVQFVTNIHRTRKPHKRKHWIDKPTSPIDDMLIKYTHLFKNSVFFHRFVHSQFQYVTPVNLFDFIVFTFPHDTHTPETETDSESKRKTRPNHFFFGHWRPSKFVSVKLVFQNQINLAKKQKSIFWMVSISFLSLVVLWLSMPPLSLLLSLSLFLW